MPIDLRLGDINRQEPLTEEERRDRLYMALRRDAASERELRFNVRQDVTLPDPVTLDSILTAIEAEQIEFVPEHLRPAVAAEVCRFGLSATSHVPGRRAGPSINPEGEMAVSWVWDPPGPEEVSCDDGTQVRCFRPGEARCRLPSSCDSPPPKSVWEHLRNPIL